MPVKQQSSPEFKPSREIEVLWDGFEGGWNSIFRPTELQDNELAQADNLMLVGKGVPTGRWGSEIFYKAGESGRIRLLNAYYNSTASQNSLLAITDDGILTKKSGASYTPITGASYPSGSTFQAVQMDNKMYIAGGDTPFSYFDGVDLITFEGLSTPTNISLSQLSAASGTTEYSWRISAHSKTGETLASQTKSLLNMPLDLSKTLIQVQWGAVSAASGVLQGYNIYRGFPGDESWIASAGDKDTQFLDNGAYQGIVLPPLEDTTRGVRAKYILRFEDRLIMAGVEGEPSKVFVSGRYPNQNNFTVAEGGNYIYVSPNDGDEITGLGIAANQQTGFESPSAILVFKKNSVHRIVLGTVQLGNFFITEPAAQLLTVGSGCSSADTIVSVKNDTFYFGNNGLFSVGQEPAFLNQLRTNELSARIRPYMQSLTAQDRSEATASYIDNKYLLSFPTRKETIVYDMERGCFMGPWKTPWGITKWFRYSDTDGSEKWLAGSTDSQYVRQFSPSYISDSGVTIKKILRTKKDDLKGWSIMKVLKFLYVLFRNVRGIVDVNLLIEERSGATKVTKSFSIRSSLGSGGWGSDQYGTQPYGKTDALVVLTGEELARYAQIYKTVRVAQIEVVTNNANSNFEFLGARMTAQPLGDSSMPSSRKV